MYVRNYGYRKVLEQLNIPFRVVSLRNHTVLFLDDNNNIANIDHQLELQDILAKPFVPLGSVAFDRLFRDEPFNLFHKSLLSVSQITKHIDKRYFVNDYIVCDLLKNLSVSLDEFFLRPLEDNKAITGGVYSQVDVSLLQKQASHQQDTALINTSLFTISPVVTIKSESRFFVVDDKIVASSNYARYSKYDTSGDVSITKIRLAEMIVNSFPEIGKHFVIDIGELVDGSVKIIEFNGLQMSGTYRADPFAIIMALNKCL